MSTETAPTTYHVSCACCHRRLGWVTKDGWHWLSGSPARLVNRRRLIASYPLDTIEIEDVPAAPVDDFRQRSVERTRFPDRKILLWEYPYVCDSDDCCDGLGLEWEKTPDGEQRWVKLPQGVTVQ